MQLNTNLFQEQATNNEDGKTVQRDKKIFFDKFDCFTTGFFLRQ